MRQIYDTLLRMRARPTTMGMDDVDDLIAACEIAADILGIKEDEEDRLINELSKTYNKKWL